MNPNTYIQLNQSRPMGHGGDVGVAIQLNQKGAIAQAGDVGVVFQPKRAARQITRACRIGMDFGSTE